MAERGFRNRVGEILGEDDAQVSPGGALERWLAPTSESRVEQVPVDAVDDAPWRPSGDDDPTAYRALKASVRASGILQPVVLRRVSAERLQVVSGARRLRAARETAQSTVPALIRDLSDLEALMGGWDAVLRAGVTIAERDRLTTDLTGAGLAAADVSALMATVPLREAVDETAGSDAEVVTAEPAVADAGPEVPAAESAVAGADAVEVEPEVVMPVADAVTAPSESEVAGEPEGASAGADAASVAPDGEVDPPLTATDALLTEAAPDVDVVVRTPADVMATQAAPDVDRVETPAPAAEPETAGVSADVVTDAPAVETHDDIRDHAGVDAEEATETLVGTLPVVLPEEDVTPVHEVEWREAVVAAVVDEERLEPEGLVESAVELEEAGRPEPDVVAEPEPEPTAEPIAVVEATPESAPTVETIAVVEAPEPEPTREPVTEPAGDGEPPTRTRGRRAAATPTVIPIDLPAEAPDVATEEVGAPVTAPLGAGEEAWSPRVAAAASLPSEPVTADVVGASGGTAGVARLLADPRTYATAGVFLVVWAVVFIIVSVLLGAGGGRPLVAAAVVAVVGILATMGGLAMPRRGL